MISNFKKYKRFFTFGCSFTMHRWPTWPHILASEMDDVELFNFGKAGASNMLISLRLAEANKRYKFNETDLIGIMWTSNTREDRFITDYGWMCMGNVYNQDILPKEYVKKFADPNSYLIRDYALMELVNGYVKSLPATTFQMLGWTPGLIENREGEDNSFTKVLHDRVLDLYSDNAKNFSINMRDWINNTYWKEDLAKHYDMGGYQYLQDGKLHTDGHPRPIIFYEYLKHLGFPLTEKSSNYANKIENLLQECKTSHDIHNMFQDVYMINNPEGRGQIF